MSDKSVFPDRAEALTSVAAMAVSFGTFDYISGGVIAALVILNVSVGAYTEWQAEKVSLDHYRANIRLSHLLNL